MYHLLLFCPRPPTSLLFPPSQISFNPPTAADGSPLPSGVDVSAPAGGRAAYGTFKGDTGSINAPEEDTETPCCYMPRRIIASILMFFLMFILYLQRVVISVTIVPIAQQEGWDTSKQGLLLSAFFWGYAITQIPGGILTTRFGAKNVLFISEFISLALTASFPFTIDFFPLAIASRFVLGLAHGPTMPAAAQCISMWFPHGEKPLAGSINMAGTAIGQVAALGVTGFIATHINWQSSYFIYSGVVALWLVLWLVFFSNKPSQDSCCIPVHPSELNFIVRNRDPKKEEVKEAAALLKEQTPGIIEEVRPAPAKEKEDASVSTIPWGAILTTPCFYGDIIGLFAANWTTYVFMSWLPTYMTHHLNMSLTNAGLYSLLPTLVKGILAPFVGALAQLLQRKGIRVIIIRRIFASITLTVPAACLIAISFVDLPGWAIITLLIVTLGITSTQTSGIESNHFDLSTKYAGLLMSINNTTASVPGIVGVYLGGWLLNTTNNNWASVFLLAAAVGLVGWLSFLALARADAIDFDTRGVGCCKGRGGPKKSKKNNGDLERQPLFDPDAEQRM